MLVLNFFHVLPTFYAWVFPLNVMVTASMLIGLAAGLALRRQSRVRWVFCGLCLLVLAAGELIWQRFPSEDMIFFYVCGWCAEAALLCCAIGTLCRLIRTNVRYC